MTSPIFEVYIEENSHFADENERCKIGTFVNSEDALVACRKIIDDFLTTNYESGMTAGELYQQYAMFGEDAFIVSNSPSENFSAWAYAEERCRQICDDKLKK